MINIINMEKMDSKDMNARRESLGTDGMYIIRDKLSCHFGVTQTQERTSSGSLAVLRSLLHRVLNFELMIVSLAVTQ